MTVRVLATMIGVAIMAGGCGWRPFGAAKPAEAEAPTLAPTTASGPTTKLPDYPEAATTIGAGQSVEYARTTITLDQLAPRDGVMSARFTLRDREGAMTYDVAIGSVIVHKDLLLRVTTRKSATATGAVSTDTPRVVLTLHRLSQLASPAAPRVVREWPSMRAGDAGFFSGGFVALRQINENDRNSLDDESVAVVLGLGDDVQTVSLREFSTLRAGNWVLELGDVFGGDTQDGPSANVRVRPVEVAESEAPTGESASSLAWGKPLAFESGDLMVDPIDPPPATAREGAEARTRVLLTADDGIDVREVVLLPGQTWRWGKRAFRLDDVNSSGVVLAQLQYPTDRRPAEARSLVSARNPRILPTDPNAPVRQTVTLTEGETTTFWSTEIQLVRVTDNNRTDLFDDEAEFLVRDGGQVLSFRLREGSRDTIHGTNRWVVVEVRDLQPPAGKRSGEATVLLSTGSFVGNTADPRIGAEPR